MQAQKNEKKQKQVNNQSLFVDTGQRSKPASSKLQEKVKGQNLEFHKFRKSQRSKPGVSNLQKSQRSKPWSFQTSEKVKGQNLEFQKFRTSRSLMFSNVKEKAQKQLSRKFRLAHNHTT